jgi:hypothetical protein
MDQQQPLNPQTAQQPQESLSELAAMEDAADESRMDIQGRTLDRLLAERGAPAPQPPAQ